MGKELKRSKLLFTIVLLMAIAGCNVGGTASNNTTTPRGEYNSEADYTYFREYSRGNNYSYIQSFTLKGVYELYEKGVVDLSPEEQLQIDSDRLGIGITHYRDILDKLSITGGVYEEDRFIIYYDTQRHIYSISGK